MSYRVTLSSTIATAMHIQPDSPDARNKPVTWLANFPLLCWLTALALVGLCYYFDAYGHALYRDTRRTPDYRAEARVEDYCLWLATMVAAIGIVISVVGLVVIRRSGSRIRGIYRLSIGMVFNLLTVLAVLFTLFVRGLLNGANAA